MRILALTVLLTCPALAQTERLKLLALDGDAGSHFGYSLGVGEEVCVVGAWRDSDLGTWSGSAYIFDLVSGAQTFKLLPSGGRAGDRFGWSAGASRGLAVVGAYGDDAGGPEAGAAYLFDLDNGRELLKLVARDALPGDRFGWSVALDSNWVVVGAPGDPNGGGASGAVYVFDVASGVQLFKLQGPGSGTDTGFGRSVALGGGRILVGADQDDQGGADAGAAYLFDAATGALLSTLLAKDAAAGDFFGTSVALDVSVGSPMAVVGAPNDFAKGARKGSAYLFDGATGKQLAKLLASDGEGGDRFGQCVGLDGLTVIVGAYGDSDAGDKSGSAYLFDVSSGLQSSKLLASDGAPWDFFGNAVAVRGAMILVGADRDDDQGQDAGVAFVFDNPLVDCNANGVPDSIDISSGTSPDCDGNGVPDECDLLDPTLDWNGDGILDVCVSANYCSANPNSSGQAGRMSLAGSPLIVDNNLTLAASGLPVSEWGYFLMSMAQGFVPNVGGTAGNLCLGTPLYRLNRPPSGAVQNSGPTGSFSVSLDLQRLPQGLGVTPGDTWNFQAWHRDTPTSTSNLTDGISVMFR